MTSARSTEPPRFRESCGKQESLGPCPTMRSFASGGGVKGEQPAWQSRQRLPADIREQPCRRVVPNFIATTTLPATNVALPSAVAPRRAAGILAWQRSHGGSRAFRVTNHVPRQHFEASALPVVGACINCGSWVLYARHLLPVHSQWLSFYGMIINTPFVSSASSTWPPLQHAPFPLITSTDIFGNIVTFPWSWTM